MARTKHDDVLHVRITNTTTVLWEGEARSVSSENTDGSFDVLPMHANFITLVMGKPLTVTLPSGEIKTYDFRQAVLYVKEGDVKVYGDLQ